MRDSGNQSNVASIRGSIRTIIMMLAFVTVAHAQSGADSAFEGIAAAYVNDLAELSPVDATLIGDHRNDGVLDQAGNSGRAAVSRIYEQHLVELQNIEWQSLSRANQVDAGLLLNELESRLWQIVSLQEWAWNPLVYVRASGNAIYGLMARDFAPLPERLENATSRLEQLPRFFDQARDSLQPQRVPKIHAETAIRGAENLSDGAEVKIASSTTASLDTVSDEG